MRHRLRQLRHLGAYPLDPPFVDHQRRQVGIGEIPVILRVFLAAHGACLVFVRIVQPCFLHHVAPVLDRFDLATDFELDRLMHEAKAVQVFYFASRAETGIAGRTHRHVGIAAEAPLLHVAVTDADPHDERMERLGVGNRFFRTSQVGLGDDLQQGRAGAVQVDAGHVARMRTVRFKSLVQRLAGILFQMRASQCDFDRATRGRNDRNRASLHNRNLVLRYLIPLRQVGVEVILAREHAAPVDGAADRQPESDRALDRALVQHRQDAGQRNIDGGRLAVRCRAKGSGRARKNLRCGGELGVGLEPDDDLPLHLRIHGAKPAGMRRCQSVVCW